jgi:hypothetical protein
LTGTVTGFVNGQSLTSATTGAARFATSATATSNVGNYAIDGSGLTANNGNYSFAQAAGNAAALTVSPALLTYLADTATTTYGNTPSGLTGTVTGFVNGQTLASATTGTAGFATGATAASNVGNYAIDGSGLTANDGNYTFAQAAGNAAALTVSPAILTITANNASKTYGDVLTFAGNEFTASGLQNGETIGDVALTSAGAAAGASVTGGPYTITSNAATGGSFNTGNYAITYKNGSLTVGQAALTVTANDDSKTYNGLAYTGGHGVTYSGFVNGENASVLGGALGYAGDSQGATNAGHYTITPDGLTAGNYAVTYKNGSLSVGQAALTVSSSNVSKAYDGGLSAIGTAVVSGGTLFGSDTLSGGSFAFTDKNVGIGKHVTINGVDVSDGNSGGNYAVTYVDNSSSSITARGITVDATGTNRVYDGTTADAVTLASAGVLSGDTVNFSGTGSFLNKHVGTSKAVGVSGIAASGADAGNYSYNTTANTTADITAKTITVDAIGADKVYDGSTAATIAALGTTGLVAGDAVTFGNASAAFADKNAGSNKAVTVSGITASGADAGNYSYNTTTNTTADISQLGITVDATGTNRVYDGTTADAVTLASVGVLSGDTVNFTGTGSFLNKHVGTSKAVGVSGIAASGADAGNYSYNTTTNTTADISQLGITVDAIGTNRVYDGTTADSVTLASAGVLSGDTVNFTGTGSFLTKNVGTGKIVSVFGITASGSEANNYSFKTSATTSADVTPATLTYRADTAHFKIGQTPGDLSGAVTGLVGGDTLADATDGMLTWQTPATAASPAGPYAIDGSGLSALNYLFEQAPGNAAALHVVDGSAPRLVVSTVAGLQQSSDDTAAVHAPYAPDVHIVNGGVRLP